jgi:hypothetical protein
MKQSCGSELRYSLERMSSLHKFRRNCVKLSYVLHINLVVTIQTKKMKIQQKKNYHEYADEFGLSVYGSFSEKERENTFFLSKS